MFAYGRMHPKFAPLRAFHHPEKSGMGNPETIMGASGGRRSRKSEFTLSPDANLFFELNRMLSDNHPTLSAYVSEIMKRFERADRFTIYVASERTVDGKEKRVLEHRLTVEQPSEGAFKTRNVDDEYSIMDARELSLKAFRERKPTVIDYEHGMKLEFRNLDWHDKNYKRFHVRTDGKKGMNIRMPFCYRGVLTGLIEIEGDLGVRGFSFQGEERLSLSAGVVSCVGSSLGLQLCKFDGTTRLLGKNDFKLDLYGIIKKLHRSKNGKQGHAFMLLIDLDHFKRINDECGGHLKGDELLRMVAETIKESVREKPRMNEDWEPDNIYRWGGEEFIVLLSGEFTPQEACAIAKRINRNISALLFRGADGKPIPVSCSIGAVDIGALLEESGCRGAKKGSEMLFGKCDDLMYLAKERGRNRVYFTELRDGKLVEVEYTNGDGKHEE